MLKTARILSALLACGTFALSSPSVWAQQARGPANAEVSSAQVEQLVAAFVAQLSGTPEQIRAASEQLGSQLAQANPALMAAVVSRVSAAMSGSLPRERSIQVLQQFSTGLTLGLTSANPAQARQLVSQAIVAAVAGAGQNEARVGEVARVVSAGVVEAIVTTNTAIPISEAAVLVQSSVSRGASQVVGRDVVVSVISTDSKPVSDVVLTTSDGKQLDRGSDKVVFVPIQKKDNEGDTKSPVTSPS